MKEAKLCARGGPDNYWAKTEESPTYTKGSKRVLIERKPKPDLSKLIQSPDNLLSMLEPVKQKTNRLA